MVPKRMVNSRSKGDHVKQVEDLSQNRVEVGCWRRFGLQRRDEVAARTRLNQASGLAELLS